VALHLGKTWVYGALINNICLGGWRPAQRQSEASVLVSMTWFRLRSTNCLGEAAPPWPT